MQQTGQPLNELHTGSSVATMAYNKSFCYFVEEIEEKHCSRLTNDLNTDSSVVNRVSQ